MSQLLTFILVTCLQPLMLMSMLMHNRNWSDFLDFLMGCRDVTCLIDTHIHIYIMSHAACMIYNATFYLYILVLTRFLTRYKRYLCMVYVSIK